MLAITQNNCTQHSLESTTGGKDECIICANHITWYAVGPCNHRTCHVCALRLRALYKNTNCTYCKVEQAFVVFTAHPSKLYEDYLPQDLVHFDKKTSIFFDSKEIFEETMVFLLYNCPEENCVVSCHGGWTELNTHVKTAHGRLLCDLCTRHKKVFFHEHALFTHAELDLHLRGEDLSNEIQPSGFKGHPKCGFCKTAFYGADELFEHCRNKHEQCFVCQRLGVEGARDQFYANYDTLEKHFSSEHILCEDAECLAQKFVVFATEIDFKLHIREKHPKYSFSQYSQGRQRSDQRRAMQVQVNFTYAGGSDQNRDNRGRGGRQANDSNGRERNRRNEERVSNVPMRSEVNQHTRRRTGGNPDVFTLPGRGSVAQTSMHSNRGQNARQQRAPDEFSEVGQPQPTPEGSRLQQNVQTSTLRQRQQEQWPVLGEATSVASSKSLSKKGTSRKPPPGFGTLMDNETAVASMEIREALNPETAQRYAAFIVWVAGYLQNDNDKIQQFREHVNAYRGGTASENQLVADMERLFGARNSVDEIAKVLTRLVDLLGAHEEKGLVLLKAWNEKNNRMREEYPNLKGRDSTAPVAKRRVLVIKSRGSSSARSKTGARETFDRIAKAAASTTSSTAWTGSSITPTTTTSPFSHSSPALPPRPIQNPTRLEAFPSLPKASTSKYSPWVKKGTGNLTSSAWNEPKGGGSKGQEEEDLQLALALSMSSIDSAGGKKKSGKKKVLLHIG